MFNGFTYNDWPVIHGDPIPVILDDENLSLAAKAVACQIAMGIKPTERLKYWNPDAERDWPVKGSKGGYEYRFGHCSDDIDDINRARNELIYAGYLIDGVSWGGERTYHLYEEPQDPMPRKSKLERIRDEQSPS